MRRKRMLKVVGHRVMVKLDPIVDEEVTAGGIVIPQQESKKRLEVAAEKGTVMQVGPMAWKNEALGYGTDSWEPWCKPGDRVLYSKYAGKVVEDPEDGEKYMMLNDVDIQAKIEKE
jgi:co-chaperonin GroES (HSP10)